MWTYMYMYMYPLHTHIMHLYVEEMELYWVIAVDILISKEEFLPESEDDRAA